jgi:hypothetical protein
VIGERTPLSLRPFKQSALSHALVVTTIGLAAILGLYVFATITVFPVTPQTSWTLETNGSQGLFTITALAYGSAVERRSVHRGRRKIDQFSAGHNRARAADRIAPLTAGSGTDS